MLSKYGRQLVAEPVTRLVAWLHSTGITPNTLTYTGFILTVFSAIVLGTGYFRIGGLLLFVAALFDMLDGSLARAAGQSSTFGAFLDSTLDRYAESVTFLALAYYYSGSTGARTELMLIFVILVGSLMVSYTRARAEALNIECKVGLLQRPERVFLLILGLVTGWMLFILWLLAILTNVTAIQRIYETYWRIHEKERSAHDRKAVKSSDNRPVQG